MSANKCSLVSLGYTNQVSGPHPRPFVAGCARGFFVAGHMPCAHAQTDLFHCRQFVAVLKTS